MIALKNLLTYFHGPASNCLQRRGPLPPRVREESPPGGALRPGRAEEGGRPEQITVAQTEDRRGWVHLRPAEGSESKEATGTARRWWAG